jgi:tRNA(Ile)-lysidine synthase
MESTRKPSSNELRSQVAARLARSLTPGTRLAVGLSGGVDSVVLLSLLADLAPELGYSLSAIHVNHAISPSAPRWAEFCAVLCREKNVPLRIEAVDISRWTGLGLEGAARRARYDAFARLDADVLAVAQHRDDQAETLLLQLLRGAGLRGMAGMPAERLLEGTGIRLVRPLLGVARADIEAYARARGLAWVEDESNADTAHRRNFLRHEVLPLIERQFPSARAALARGAGRLHEAGGLVDHLARADLEHLGGMPVEVAALRALGEARARSVLRHCCDQRGIAPPGSARLDEVLRQLGDARRDAAVAIPVSGWSFHRYRGRVYLEPARAAPESGLREPWSGESALPLMDLGGVLRFKPEEGRGLSAGKLRRSPVTVRVRRGGEHLQPDCRRPRRTLKNLMQERQVPPWRRRRLPLVYCGEDLVSVPGVGDECSYQADVGESGLIVSWEPFDP